MSQAFQTRDCHKEKQLIRGGKKIFLPLMQSQVLLQSGLKLVDFLGKNEVNLFVF